VPECGFTVRLAFDKGPSAGAQEHALNVIHKQVLEGRYLWREFSQAFSRGHSRSEPCSGGFKTVYLRDFDPRKLTPKRILYVAAGVKAAMGAS
jgi:hypothetical protein